MVETCSLTTVVKNCEGRLIGASDLQIRRICLDSRLVAEGDLYIALKGDRFDGHEFVREVFQKGAVAVIVEEGKEQEGTPGPQILVRNTRKALAQIAARYREQFDIPLVVVGGSNGKTTTKELIAAILRSSRNVLWSEASFNNDIGVPLTLLKLEKQHQVAVLEAGTNHPGELAPLLDLIRPKIGVITSIGREHLEHFGDVNGVAQEEGTVAEKLPADGLLIVNGDSPEMESIVARTTARVIRVGWNAPNQWRITKAEMNSGGTRFWIKCTESNWEGEYETRLFGRHQTVNATIAIVVGKELGLGREAVTRGLLECVGAKSRLQLKQFGQVRLLDDCYNANADSMKAALETLQEFPCHGRRIAILGEMAELGASSEEAHIEIGRETVLKNVDSLIAIGPRTEAMSQAATASGLKTVFWFANVEQALVQIDKSVGANDVVLVKASRSARLERVVEFFKARAEQGGK